MVRRRPAPRLAVDREQPLWEPITATMSRSVSSARIGRRWCPVGSSTRQRVLPPRRQPAVRRSGRAAPAAVAPPQPAAAYVASGSPSTLSTTTASGRCASTSSSRRCSARSPSSPSRAATRARTCSCQGSSPPRRANRPTDRSSSSSRTTCTNVPPPSCAAFSNFAISPRLASSCGITTSRPPRRCAVAIASATGRTTSPVSSKRSRQPPTSPRSRSTSRSSVPGWSST